jgi:hypothetical protein
MELHRRLLHNHRDVLAEVEMTITAATNMGLLRTDPQLLAPEAAAQWGGREEQVRDFARWLGELVDAMPGADESRG